MLSKERHQTATGPLLAKQNFNALIAEFEALDKRISEIDKTLEPSLALASTVETAILLYYRKLIAFVEKWRVYVCR